MEGAVETMFMSNEHQQYVIRYLRCTTNIKPPIICERHEYKETITISKSSEWNHPNHAHLSYIFVEIQQV